MTRKSKQPGGINPLTYSERQKLKDYGTQRARLTTESQLKFGQCCLTLELAKDPVVTPSGHIYSREAIVSYLLTKNQELAKQREGYEESLLQEEETLKLEEAKQFSKKVETFVKRAEGTIKEASSEHESNLKDRVGKRIDLESNNAKKASLKRSSYWLSQYAPEHVEEKIKAPPKRPASPMTGQPLRLKDLIPLDCKVDESGKQFLCSVSSKSLSTQEVVCIKKTKQIMLRSVYNDLAKPSMICPVTGKKFKEKDVLLLKKAASGFAASGEVEAKKYRHTLT